MKSKANINGHPIHPILVTFPVAFFSGTLFFDLMALMEPLGIYARIAHYLAISGIVTALLAAIPGIIDYLYTVPPQSTAKKRATQHGLLNVGVLVLFVLALVYRSYAVSPSETIIVLLELVAVAMLAVAGWMGGTLVTRNQIGIDIRYANAGKWSEEKRDIVNGIVPVGSLQELKSNQMRLIKVDQKRLVVAKSETNCVAFDDRCTHRGASLAGGTLICGTVQCPWHGSQFDVKTGHVKAGPAQEKIATYPLQENGDQLYIEPSW